MAWRRIRHITAGSVFAAGCGAAQPPPVPGKPPPSAVARCQAPGGDGVPTDESLWGPDAHRKRETRRTTEPPPPQFPSPADTAARFKALSVELCAGTELLERMGIAVARAGTTRATLSFRPGNFAEYTSYDGRVENMSLVSGVLTVELGPNGPRLESIADLDVNGEGMIVVHAREFDDKCDLEAAIAVTKAETDLVFIVEDRERGRLESKWRDECR